MNPSLLVNMITCVLANAMSLLHDHLHFLKMVIYENQLSVLLEMCLSHIPCHMEIYQETLPLLSTVDICYRVWSDQKEAQIVMCEMYTLHIHWWWVYCCV